MSNALIISNALIQAMYTNNLEIIKPLLDHPECDPNIIIERLYQTPTTAFLEAISTDNMDHSTKPKHGIDSNPEQLNLEEQAQLAGEVIEDLYS